MGYLRDWESQVDAVPGLTRGEKALRKLSKETLEGWKITSKEIAYTKACILCTYFLLLVRSFVELVRYIFTVEGSEKCFFLSAHVDQDPLEKTSSARREHVGAGRTIHLSRSLP